MTFFGPFADVTWFSLSGSIYYGPCSAKGYVQPRRRCNIPLLTGIDTAQFRSAVKPCFGLDASFSVTRRLDWSQLLKSFERLVSLCLALCFDDAVDVDV